ncbi:MAG: hypothetical protein ABSF29_12490 [Tepidisphaeraceae bacterium]|jgi:hypothetical protein
MFRRIGVYTLVVVLAALVAPLRADDSDSVIIKSRDGDLQLSLPTGWDSLTPDKSQISAIDGSKHEQVEVYTENHADVRDGLRSHAQHWCDGFVKQFDDSTCTTGNEVQFGSNNAMQYEIHGTVKDDQRKLGIELSIVEMDRHYAEVIAYCPESNFSDNQSDLQDLPRGLSEIYGSGN